MRMLKVKSPDEADTERDTIYADISFALLEAHYAIGDLIDRYYDPAESEEVNKEHVLQKVVEAIYGNKTRNTAKS